ncbi:MAG: AsmA-like C-terminal region-containing protein [Nitrospiraceae bacterium]
MTKRSRVLSRILLALLLLGAVLVGCYFLYDPEYVKGVLLQQVERQVGRKIEVGQARLEFFPRIRLVLSDVLIRDIDASRIFFKAERLDLVLRSTPLLNLRLVIKRLFVDRPVIEIRRDRTGQWNVLAAPARVADELPSGANPISLALLVQETTLVQGEITIVDEFRPGGVRSARLDRMDMKILTGVDGSLADVRLEAMLPGGRGASALSLAGRVTQAGAPVRLAPGEAGATMLAVQLDGRAEALNLDLRQVADFFGPRPVPEKISGSSNLRGTIKMVPGVAGYDVVFSDMTVDMGRLSLKGQASLSGLMAAQPTFSVTFSSTPVSLEELQDRFPVHWLHPQIETIMDEHEMGGIVEVLKATVTGTVSPAPDISMAGEFRVLEGHTVVGRARTLVQDLAAIVVVEPDRVKVASFTGQYGSMQISEGKATLSFLETGPWLEISVGGAMPASDLIPFLAGSVQSARASAALAALQDVKGTGTVSFRLAGSLAEAESLKFVGGEIVTQDLGFRSPALSEQVDGVRGRLRMSPKGLEFDKVTGRMGSSQFDLQGAISAGEKEEFQSFKVQTQADVAQVLQLLPAGLFSSLSPQGKIGAAVALSGPIDAPRMKVALGLKETGLIFPGNVRKPVGTPASLELEGELSRQSVLTVTRVELAIPPLRVVGKGTVRLRGEYSVDVTLVSGPVALDTLPRGVLPEGIEAGILEVSLDVKGQGKPSEDWQVNGWVALTDGVLKGGGLVAPVTNLYLRLKLVRSGAEIKRLAFRMQESDVNVTGTVRKWKTTPLVNLKIESFQLDFDLLIPKGERTPLRNGLEHLAAGTRLVATLTIDRGLYKKVEISDVSARISMRNGVLDADRIRALVDEGTITGRLVTRLPREKPADLDLSFDVTGLPAEKISYFLEDEARLIRGPLAVNGMLRWNGRNPRGLLHTLSGKVDGRIGKGRIERGTIVPKIISLLNLPALLQGKLDLAREGIPFDKLAGTFVFRNGLITEGSIVMDSPVVKLTAAGTYDITSDQVDAVYIVSPLGSYAQLLKSIPLFGKLFAGERRGIDTAIFEVKGPRSDPKVTYLPLESLKTGLTGMAQFAFDLLKNLVMLPKELIAPSKGESSATENTPPPDQPSIASP